MKTLGIVETEDRLVVEFGGWLSAFDRESARQMISKMSLVTFGVQPSYEKGSIYVRRVPSGLVFYGPDPQQTWCHVSKTEAKRLAVALAEFIGFKSVEAE